MQLTPIRLQVVQIENDLKAFRALLNQKKELGERDDILPFFKAHPHLSAFLANFSNAAVPDCYAHEYQIGGNFACDFLPAAAQVTIMSLSNLKTQRQRVFSESIKNAKCPNGLPGLNTVSVKSWTDFITLTISGRLSNSGVIFRPVPHLLWECG